MVPTKRDREDVVTEPDGAHFLDSYYRLAQPEDDLRAATTINAWHSISARKRSSTLNGAADRAKVDPCLLAHIVTG
jgi:hypothetical protein